MMNMLRRCLAPIGIMLVMQVEVLAQDAVVSRSAHELMARDIFAKVIAMDTSVNGLQTRQMADYLSGLFHDAGFPPEHVKEVPIGQDLV